MAGDIPTLSRKATFKAQDAALVTPELTPLLPSSAAANTSLSPAQPSQPARKSIKRKVPELPKSPVGPAPATSLYWYKTPVFGRLPSHGFRAHTCTVVGSELFLFGGCADKGCWRDIWKLDLDSLYWTKPPIAPHSPDKVYPPPCRAHTATRVGRHLVCIGGGDGPSYFNHTWVFDTHALEWSKPEIFGEVPSARRAHAAFLYKTKIYVFGGGNGERALNDLFALDVSDSAMARLTWTQVRTSGDLPGQRGYHTFDRVGSQAVLFGGSDGSSCFHDVHLLDLETFVWSKLPIANPRPEFARLSHSSVVLGSYIYYFFGHDGQNYVNDTIALNLVTLQFEIRPTAGSQPAPRGYATTSLYDNRIFCVGGYNGKQVIDETLTLELGASAFQQQISNFVIASAVEE